MSVISNVKDVANNNERSFINAMDNRLSKGKSGMVSNY